MQVVGAMGACGGKAKRQGSREVLLNEGFRYSQLESNEFDLLWADSDEENLDILQFAAPIFVAEEGEAFSVKLMRMGSLSGTVSCHFQTEGGSAKAGERYVHAEGEVVFGDGQFQQSIDIQILDSPSFSATLEFKVVLSNPQGCILGKYLKLCRVKVLDGDPFPNSDYAEAVNAGLHAVEEINPVPLFLDFCKLMLQIPGNSWRFAVTLLLDQLKNAYVWFGLVASVYMVNVIFGGEDAEDRLVIPGDAVGTAKLLGLMYIGLPLLLHFCKEAKTRMDIAGRCGFYLQTSLMRKYMNFSEDSRAAVSASEVQRIVSAKAMELSASLDNMSSMLETLGRLVMLNYFAVSSDPGMLWAVVAMPVVMTFWVLLRQRWLTKPEEDSPYKRRVADLVGSISEYYPLIAAYFQRPAMNEEFAERVTKLSEVQEPLGIYAMRSEFFFAWLGPSFAGFYLCFYAQQVIEHQLSLGTFLATISVFKEVASNFADGYSVMKSVISKFEPLIDIAVFFNRSTDVRDLKESVNRRITETHQQRTRLLQLSTPTPPGMVRTDMIPIHLENVSFKAGGQRELLRNVNISVEQGKLIALQGEHGSGKTKLIRLLAGGLTPTSGKVIMPSHLRCLLVTHQVVVMNTTPLQNLFFGDPLALAQDENRHRVMRILDKLRMSRTREFAETEVSILQEPVSEEEAVDTGCCGTSGKVEPQPNEQWTPPQGSKRDQRLQSVLRGWEDALSFQEKAKLHIARALVVNPEILVLEKPLMNFDERESQLVQSILKEHVSNRGGDFMLRLHFLRCLLIIRSISCLVLDWIRALLFFLKLPGVALPLESRDKRRPRTCFYSAERENGSQIDVVWKCGNGNVVAENPAEQSPKPLKGKKQMSSPKSAVTADSV